MEGGDFGAIKLRRDGYPDCINVSTLSLFNMD